MRAIKINSENRTITEVQVSSAKDIYAHLGDNVDYVCCPVLYDNNDCLYADDEGWFKETTGGYIFPDWSYPIVNNGLILGTDDEGESVDAKTDIKELEAKITWVSVEQMLNFKSENL